MFENKVASNWGSDEEEESSDENGDETKTMR